MTDPAPQHGSRDRARSAFGAGARDTVGLALGGLVFGLLFGVLAIGRGLTPAQALLMSATAFAGAAQIAVLEIWNDPLPYVPIAMTAALVCTRHVLMGITLYDALSCRRKWPPFGALLLMTDANWVLTARNPQQPNRMAYFVGSGLTMYLAWMVGTVIGVGLPELLDAVTISGLRIGGSLFLSILLCIFLRGDSPTRFVGPATAVVTAVLASRVVAAEVALLVGVAAAALVTLLREVRARG